jgi:hypothetical protein
MAARIDDDDVGGLQRRRRYLFDMGEEALAGARLVDDGGVSVRPQRRAGRNVSVQRRPGGALAKSFWPRGAVALIQSALPAVTVL